MIADSSITLTCLSSSPWNSDSHLSKDINPSLYNRLSFSTESIDQFINSQDVESELSTRNFTSTTPTPVSSTACSQASSECSEDTCVDPTEIATPRDTFFGLDYMDNPLLNMFEDGQLKDPILVGDWSDNELSLDTGSLDGTTEDIDLPLSKATKKRKRKNSTKKDISSWDISNDGQEHLIEALDLECVNNQKMQRLHQDHDLCTSCNDYRNIPESTPSSSSSSSSILNQPAVINTFNNKSNKKHQTKDKRLKVAKQQQRKECKQALKEKKSGLFHNEEVLALSIETEDQDVDIL